jgi:hypothetical protein
MRRDHHLPAIGGVLGPDWVVGLDNSKSIVTMAAENAAKAAAKVSFNHGAAALIPRRSTPTESGRAPGFPAGNEQPLGGRPVRASRARGQRHKSIYRNGL